MSRSTQQRSLCRGHFVTIVTTREQVPIDVGRHRYRGMAHPLLYHLQWQPETSILGTVDQPRRVEVAKRMKAGVLGSAMAVDNAGCDHGRYETAVDDVRVALNVGGAVREDEIHFTLGAGQLPFLQNVDHNRRDGNRPLAGIRLRPADLPELVCPLAHADCLLFEVDVLPPQAPQFR